MRCVYSNFIGDGRRTNNYLRTRGDTLTLIQDRQTYSQSQRLPSGSAAALGSPRR